LNDIDRVDAQGIIGWLSVGKSERCQSRRGQTNPSVKRSMGLN
jgi:hypothetical protein